MALLQPGAQFGAYRIQSVLGAGGMGEVYRASDSRLNRDIALKVLPEVFALDPERLARFEREAQVLASLNHANIGVIYGLEEAGGIRALVLELVEGPTLADRISEGPVPVPEALRIASQIALALEVAHEKGVIHRDLKPSNIKLTSDGAVKVLDFGLAKFSDPGVADLTQQPTISARTRQGIVLGTPAYMSPEQARGLPLDKRTDVWAFGCIVFEMLTGQMAFGGATTSDTIAAILDREPNWRALPAATPPSVIQVLRRCLEKDAKRRLRDIGDARVEIEDVKDERSIALLPGAAAGHRWPAFVRAIIVFVVGGLVGVVVATRLRTEPRPSISSTVQFVLALSPTDRLAGLDSPAMAISPDGSQLAYVATRAGQPQLFTRLMASLEATALPGTGNATNPFFSPDGHWIGFFADGELKKLPIAGGAPVTVCEAPIGLGASWGTDDSIVFASSTGSALLQVAAAGGKPRRLTTLDVQKGEFSHRWPELLPGGKAIVYTVGTVGNWDDAQIVGQSLATGRRSVLVQGGTNPHYLPSGHLVYVRSGALFAVPFDPDALKVSGTPVRILESVVESSDGGAQLAVSRSGSAVYLAGGFQADQRRLVSVDRAGLATPLAAPPRAYSFPRMSSDGRRLLVTIRGSTDGIWLYEMMTGALAPLVSDVSSSFPIWAPDGQHAAFSSNKGDVPNLFSISLSEQRALERLTTSDHLQLPGSWSPDGRLLAFVERHPTTGRDISLLSSDLDRVARPFLASPFDESAPRFSPDGRWIAYVLNESGSNEVYLASLADPARRARVSDAGGAEPVWGPDGRELFYRSGRKMMSVAVTAGTMNTTTPHALFEGDFEPGTIDAANYDITPDRQRFVMVTTTDRGSGQPALHVLINWFGGRTSVPPTPAR